MSRTAASLLPPAPVGAALHTGTRNRSITAGRVGRPAIGRHSRGREHGTDTEVIIREALADLAEHPENCRCVRRAGRRRARRR